MLFDIRLLGYRMLLSTNLRNQPYSHSATVDAPFSLFQVYGFSPAWRWCSVRHQRLTSSMTLIPSPSLLICSALRFYHTCTSYEQQSSWLGCDLSGFQVLLQTVRPASLRFTAVLLQFVILSRVPDPAESFQDCFFVMYCG